MSESAFGVHSAELTLESSEQPVRAPDVVPLADLRRSSPGYAVTSRTLPPSAYALHFVLPARPRFVVICTTPFAAAVP